MKVATNFNILIALSHFLKKAVAEQSCIVGGFQLPDIDGPCNYQNVLTTFKNIFEDTLIKNRGCNNTAEEDLRLLLNAKNYAQSEKSVISSCEEALDQADRIPFDKIARKKGGQFEKDFYNGGTYWNEEVETNLESFDGSKTNVLREDAKNVKYFYNYLAQTTHVEWPRHLTNFELDKCEINAAYCCWPQDRQANDNNGNCNTPYDTNCIDKDPADNTDLCYVDNQRGYKSTGLDSGFSVFPNDNNDGEGPIHCHGFAWSNDEYDFTSRYKANNLFFVSMYDHMHQRGYVGNIPGAPMCACAEQMPTVTRSDCTQIDVEEIYSFAYDPVEMKFKAELIELEIDFNSCRGLNNRNNDLSAYVGRLHQEGKITSTQRGKLSKYLVENGNCPYSIDAFLNEKGYVKGYMHDESVWTKFVGRDSLATLSSIGKEGFRLLFENTPNQIIQRVCITCDPSHQFIYYKRISPIPKDMDLLNYMKNYWKSKDNKLNEDFKLFSTYQDALAEKNPWKFCNYDHSHTGFPRECGPSKLTRNQWSKFEWRGGREDVAFYVEKSEIEFNELNVKSIGNVGLIGTDVGNVGRKGQSLEHDGTYYITASGHDIWNREDEFHFLSEEASGDMTLVTKVSSLAHVHTWSKAGLMIRDSLNPGSKHVMVVLSREYGVTTQFRTETDQHSGVTYTGNFMAMDEVWLKLTRRGNIYQGYKSDDGVTWTTAGNPVTIYFEDGEEDHVGMVVNSHKDGYFAEAVFENYEFQQFYYPSAAPSLSSAPTLFVMSRDIGNPSAVGSASKAGESSYIVKGSGHDIWGSYDRFHYMSTRAANPNKIDLVVKVSSFEYQDHWAKAGIMIRDTLEPNSKFVHVSLSGRNGPSMQWRSNTGSYCDSRHGYGHKQSVWLKLEKSDDNFIGYWSDDGVNWTKMGSVVIPMERPINTGLSVTSHSNGNIATAHFDNFSSS